MLLTTTNTASSPSSVPVFELEALGSLPCGCVAAAYSSKAWDVSVVSLEAKGPHCILPGHLAGGVLRVGDGSDVPMTEGP